MKCKQIEKVASEKHISIYIEVATDGYTAIAMLERNEKDGQPPCDIVFLDSVMDPLR